MTWRRGAAAVGFAVAGLAGGCFNPRYPDGLACSDTGSCPPGQRCFAGVCHAVQPIADLALIIADAAAPPSPSLDMVPSADMAVVTPTSGADMAVPVAPGPICPSFGYFCGDDQVQNGTPGTLYNCPGPGAPTSSQPCSLGCEMRPSGSNDFCRTANGCPNALPGDWCGNDQLGGDPDWLYHCLTAGDQPSAAHPCAHGCVMMGANKNDVCSP
jgi:hypothetical protein